MLIIFRQKLQFNNDIINAISQSVTRMGKLKICLRFRGKSILCKLFQLREKHTFIASIYAYGICFQFSLSQLLFFFSSVALIMVVAMRYPTLFRKCGHWNGRKYAYLANFINMKIQELCSIFGSCIVFSSPRPSTKIQCN